MPIEERGAAIDFETYYDKEYSATKLSTWNYVFHEKFNAYRVSVYNEDISFVGKPEDFDWSSVKGIVWAMHYAGFDATVIMRLQKDGIIPADIKPSRYFDTADLAAYLRVPRNLKQASEFLLGVIMDKTVRAAMKGKQFDTLSPEETEALDKYVLTDAVNTFRLFREHGHKWPLWEQRVSELNFEAGIRGVPSNPQKVEAALEHLSTRLWKLGKQLPWVDPVPGGPPKEVPMSRKAPREQGRIEGIPVPTSFSAKDPKLIEWENEYKVDHPWVAARREYGRVNTMLKRVKNYGANIRDDNTLYYQCKYHGAGPGRFSGGSSGEGVKESGEKFNVQNMYRTAMFGVDLRGFMEAPEGFVFGVHDYNQIEAILLLWRAGDKATLNLIRGGMSIYEAYARSKLGWTGGVLKEEDDDLYRLSKALVLGAGYQCWAEAFQGAARNMAQLELPLDRCETIIKEYRAANPLIVRYWADHKKWLQFSIVRKDPTHVVKLASGRSLMYYNPCWGPKDTYGRTSMRARVVQGEHFNTLFGGKLTENEIQATARDVLTEAWVATDKAGIVTLFTVHDEFVNLYPEKEAEELVAKVDKLMVEASASWLGDCPLGVDTHLMKVYSK